MKKKALVLTGGAVIFVIFALLFYNKIHTIVSPYSGQEARAIKSLSETDMESLLNGTGVAFGGMAKPAELNGFPGPRHVLDMAQKLNLTTKQIESTEAEFVKMNKLAIEVGAELIALENKIDDAFYNKNITVESLSSLLDKSAEKYSELRSIHLSSHLNMTGILSNKQIQEYNRLRGYKIN